MANLSSWHLPTSRKGIIATVLISVILFATIFTGAWYVFYWKKTPAYSLGLIRNAVETHNYAEFEKHVDVDSLANRAFDDIVVASIAEEKGESANIKTFAMGLAQMFKQPFVAVAKDASKRFVESGSFEKAQTTEGETDKQPRFSAAEVGKKTGLASSDFKGVSYTKEDGNVAVVGISVFEKQVEKELIIELKLIKLDDGTWKITEIANLKTYMAQLKKLRAEKLARLNAPIESKIKTALTLGSVSAQIVNADPWGFSRELRVAIPVTVGSGPKPASLGGQISVANKNGATLLASGIKADLSSAEQKPILYYSFHLNQFMDGHNEILASDPKALTYTVNVSRISFADGNELKLLEALPES
ncbi:hypothetical protein [Azotosporobacter soli]|uniref:hypothetical protein n=1 Tax=Azotosporobacter soli TaxID=3055040 RepID=UPI0031FF3164